MGKVTGIGGIFFMANEDDASLRQWYADNLGMELNDFGGAILEWKNDTAEDGGLTVWHVAAKDSDWFSPSKARFMINYRVEDMDGLIDRFNANNIDIVHGPESHENGRFLWIMDPQGNKLELWEPKLWDEKNKA